MIRVELTAEQREELRARTHERGIDPRTRDRLEMVRLADTGWSIPRIARHLGYHGQTVRKYIKQFLAGGFDRLPDKPRSGRPPRLTEEMLLALERHIDQSERTWTTPQLVRWLEEQFQVRVHPDYLARVLHRRRFRWKRTKRSVSHKQKDPDLQAEKEAELDAIEDRARQGEIDLAFLDQSGFSPTMPTGYTWTRVGERKVVPYEAPQGRRVNVVGALLPFDPAGPSLVFESRCNGEGKYDADAHLRFVHKVAGLPAVFPDGYQRERPLVIVLDNYSVHHSQLVKDKMPVLEAAGVSFFFLPPYSPEMNAIEPHWRQIKYQDLPERSYKTAQSLRAAVDEALTKRAERLQSGRLCPESHTNLRRCA